MRDEFGPAAVEFDPSNPKVDRMKIARGEIPARPLARWLLLAASIAAAAPEAAMSAPEWVDGFESYAAGTFPSPNWTYSGNSQISVTNTTQESGSNSLFLYGLVGLDWAALAHRQYTAAPALMFDFSVRNGAEPLSGLHQVYGAVQLNTGPSWTLPGRGLISFGEDGLIHAAAASGGELSGPVLGPFTAGTWYDVQVEYQFNSPGTVSLGYWINGSFDGSFSYPAIAGEGSLSYLALASGAGSAWFDNVSVTVVPEPATRWLLCIGSAGLLVSRRRSRREDTAR